MNPGPTEEAGKVATSLIDNLKDQPIVLAMVVFNIIFVAAVYFSTLDLRKHQDHIIEQLIEVNSKAQTMLSACIVPPKPGG